MIACFAWTNLQIINISNAKVNLYGEDPADLYIRLGPHISEKLVEAVKASGIYENVYTFDPVVLRYKNMKFGWMPLFKVFLLKGAFRKEYDALLERLCPPKAYTRALMTWFYAENAFVLDYWARHTDKLAITLVEEGTGSYCYHKHELHFPMFMGKHLKDRLRRNLTEGPIARKLASRIDTFCLYRPEYCRPDVDYRKMTLPRVSKADNPRIYALLKEAAGSAATAAIGRYHAGKYIYFSLFSQEGAAFDAASNRILETVIEAGGAGDVIVKVHTGDPWHAENFAREFEPAVYVDRQVYIFEGLYAQLEQPETKTLVSCVSTAALNPKFMFGHEPYIIFTYRLYNPDPPCGIERDQWMARAVMDAYEDKSRVMIPNSIQELRAMIREISGAQSAPEG